MDSLYYHTLICDTYEPAEAYAWAALAAGEDVFWPRIARDNAHVVWSTGPRPDPDLPDGFTGLVLSSDEWGVGEVTVITPGGTQRAPWSHRADVLAAWLGRRKLKQARFSIRELSWMMRMTSGPCTGTELHDLLFRELMKQLSLDVTDDVSVSALGGAKHRLMGIENGEEALGYVRITFPRARWVIAAGETFLGLWDRINPREPVQTFPHTFAGQAAARAAQVCAVNRPILNAAILDGQCWTLDEPTRWGDILLLHLRPNRQVGVYSYEQGRWRNRLLTQPGAYRRIVGSPPLPPHVTITDSSDARTLANERLRLNADHWVESPHTGRPLGAVALEGAIPYPPIPDDTSPWPDWA